PCMLPPCHGPMIGEFTSRRHSHYISDWATEHPPVNPPLGGARPAAPGGTAKPGGPAAPPATPAPARPGGTPTAPAAGQPRPGTPAAPGAPGGEAKPAPAPARPAPPRVGNLGREISHGPA